MNSNCLVVGLILILAFVALPAATGNYMPLYIGVGLLVTVILIVGIAALRNSKVKDAVEQEGQDIADGIKSEIHFQIHGRLPGEGQSGHWDTQKDGILTQQVWKPGRAPKRK